MSSSQPTYSYDNFTQGYTSTITVGQTFTFQYNLAADTSNYIPQNFDSANFAVPASTAYHVFHFLYGIKQTVGATFTSKYQICYATVKLNYRFLYNIRGRAFTIKRFPWNQIMHVGLTSTFLYNIQAFMLIRTEAPRQTEQRQRQWKWQQQEQQQRDIILGLGNTTTGKTFTFQYNLNNNRPKDTTDPYYMRAMRCKVVIQSKDGVNTYYTYDSFFINQATIKIIRVDVKLADEQTGQADIVIEDHLKTIDRDKVGNGNLVQIWAGKTQADYQPLFRGYVRRTRIDRRDTGILEYTLTVYGTKVRTIERVTNFTRAARRLSFDSSVPRRSDDQMQANNLVKQLFQDTDHLPTGGPTEGDFDLSGISDDVNQFIPSIDERLTAWSSLLNLLAQSTGAIWGVNPDGNTVYFRYPTTINSGVIVKDKVEAGDRADKTCYFFGSWSYEDSIEQSQGFSNRIYGRGGSLSTPSASSSEANSFVSLFQRAIAQQFIPGAPRFSNLSLLLSKIGDPATSKIYGQIVQDDGNNRPSNRVAATFTINMSDISTSADSVFKLNIQPYTRLIQVDKPHWIILFSVGTNESNTVRWHHDNDLTTAGRYSAISDSPGTNTSSIYWTVSSTGPSFTYVLFDTQVHTTEASNEKSINKFNVIESVVDATFITENETMDKYLSGLLAYSSVPKRTYDINEVTIPDILLFPGQTIQIQDSLADLSPEDNITAQIIEVNYSFDAARFGLGTRTVSIRPIGFVNLAGFDDKVPTEIQVEIVTPPPPFPIPVGNYFHFQYKILTRQTTPPPGPPPGPPPAGPKDRFGIYKLYPTTANTVGGVQGREWISKWDNKKYRVLSRFGDRDPYDNELSWRGTGVGVIDGLGTMQVKGYSPRFYVFDPPMEKRWCNVEVTFYAKRIFEIYTHSMQGMIVASRSNHQSVSDCPCNGLGYYAAAKYDGRVHFFKEIIHGNTYGYTQEQPAPVCNTRNWWNPLTLIEDGYTVYITNNTSNIHINNHWIGYKFIIRTKTASNSVKLEYWRDLTGGRYGGDWRKMIEYTDAGGWTNPKLTINAINKACPGTGCLDKPETTDPIILRPGICTYILNEGIGLSAYKFMSCREIDPLP